MDAFAHPGGVFVGVDGVGLAVVDDGLDAEVVATQQGREVGDVDGAVALDPRDKKILLCERIDVTGVEATAFEERILEFLRHEALWNSGQLDDLIEGKSSQQRADSPLTVDLSMMIRG